RLAYSLRSLRPEGLSYQSRSAPSRFAQDDRLDKGSLDAGLKRPAPPCWPHSCALNSLLHPAKLHATRHTFSPCVVHQISDGLLTIGWNADTKFTGAAVCFVNAIGALSDIPVHAAIHVLDSAHLDGFFL